MQVDYDYLFKILLNENMMFYDDFMKIAVVAAFLHDIGKIGGATLYYDKPEHPATGYGYLTTNLSMELKSGTRLNLNNLYDEIERELIFRMSIDRDFLILIIVGIVYLHWEFGNYLRNINKAIDDGLTPDVTSYANIVNTEAKKYNKVVWDWASKTHKGYFNQEQELNYRLFIVLLMIVSVCDIQGSQLYDKDRAAEFLHYPKFKNLAKIHHGGKKFEEFRIDTVGFYLFMTVSQLPFPPA